MKKQKLYRYNKPAAKGKKAPLILCYANNEAHALQLLRERFTNDEGVAEKIDKSLIEEYVEKPKAQKKPADKKPSKGGK